MSSDANCAVADFDYHLPPELIAQEPLAERDASRLLVVDRATGSLQHDSISALPALLCPDDLIVVNNTRVLPARIFAAKAGTGGNVELLLLHRDPSGVWTCLARPAKSLKPGTELEVVTDGAFARISVLERLDEGQVRVQFRDNSDDELKRLGVTPLPPYIRRNLDDAERYQTVYARVPGSAAAPTAGLHITERLRRGLHERGIGWAEVTLHVGLDTFRPVTVDRIDDHRIHREWCLLDAEVARRITDTRSAGGRVVAVGTTSARTIESWAGEGMPNEGFAGWADLFITPGYGWKAVDALLTNFHLPRSTLLMMVSSFAGTELIRQAYRNAIEARYRFYSFGDAMLIV